MPQKSKTPSFSLKDQLFNKERVQYLAGLFQAADPEFASERFASDVMKRLNTLELKERIVHIALTLEQYLSPTFRNSAKQIQRALPPPLDPTKRDDDFGDFIIAPLGEFVVRNGLDRKHLSLSLKTLKELTKRFSMEDAIRAFINRFPVETMGELSKWSNDKNYHVRRLTSEGTRPLLPWSGRISIESDVTLPILDTLHADSTRYVTRSVANHLNDIAKTAPSLTLASLKRWKKEGLQDPKELQWMSKHALRTLVKQGNPQALKFLGFRMSPAIEVSKYIIHSKRIQAGEAIEFSFQIEAARREPLMIDYVIDFMKAGGTHSPKVHKLKQVTLAKDEVVRIAKKHVLRANATTYTLYPGKHYLTLQINGRPFGKASFQLDT